MLCSAQVCAFACLHMHVCVEECARVSACVYLHALLNIEGHNEILIFIHCTFVRPSQNKDFLLLSLILAGNCIARCLAVKSRSVAPFLSLDAVTIILTWLNKMSHWLMDVVESAINKGKQWTSFYQHYDDKIVIQEINKTFVLFIAELTIYPSSDTCS